MKTYKAVGLTALICIILTSSLWYVFGATPSSTFYISSGVYPSGSVCIWREGSSYFAKSDNGQLLYGDTNVTECYETARDAITRGTIYFKAGDYVYSNTFWLANNQYIKGDGVGATRFIQSGSADIPSGFRGGSSVNGVPSKHNITLSDFTLIGRQGGIESNNGISFENDTHIKIHDIEVYHTQRNCFFFADCSLVQMYNIHTEDAEEQQGYSFNGIFDSVFSNLIAVNCASYGMDLSYAVNVTVNNLIMRGENTTLKVDIGEAGEYCDGLTINNLFISDWGTTAHSGIIIEECYNSTISNFVITRGYRGIRVGTSVYSVIFSNGIISDTSSNGVYIADGDHVSFSNIICKDTDSTCFAIDASVDYATLININCREGGLITDVGGNSQIHLCWNGSNWIS